MVVPTLALVDAPPYSPHISFHSIPAGDLYSETLCEYLPIDVVVHELAHRYEQAMKLSIVITNSETFHCNRPISLLPWQHVARELIV